MVNQVTILNVFGSIDRVSILLIYVLGQYSSYIYKPRGIENIISNFLINCSRSNISKSNDERCHKYREWRKVKQQCQLINVTTINSRQTNQEAYLDTSNDGVNGNTGKKDGKQFYLDI